jgi:hypothetical protein
MVRDSYARGDLGGDWRGRPRTPRRRKRDPDWRDMVMLAGLCLTTLAYIADLLVHAAG